MMAGLEGAGGDLSSTVASSLFDRRMVFVRGPLDDAAAAEVALQLMSLDALGDDPVSLFVDSAGGTLSGAFAVIDVIDLLGVPVHVTCLGRAEGPAVGVVAAGDHRRAGLHARFRLSVPRVAVKGSAPDLERQADRLEEDLRRFVVRLARATGRTIEQVGTDLEEGRGLDAREAVDYGLIDEILNS
jgi:ATP-dependent Clp protease protease subunit